MEGTLKIKPTDRLDSTSQISSSWIRLVFCSMFLRTLKIPFSLLLENSTSKFGGNILGNILENILEQVFVTLHVSGDPTVSFQDELQEEYFKPDFHIIARMSACTIQPIR